MTAYDGYDNETELIEAAKTNPEAFGVLYERYVTKIYNYIYYRTGNHEDAEDLTAKVFHKALSNIARYKDRGHPFSAWLYRIAHNLVANWHRDQQKRPTLSIDEVELLGKAEDYPFQATAKHEQNALLLAAIHKLPLIRQKLLILKFAQGASNAEIGQILNRSEGAIKSLYHRTLVALKKLLADHPEILDTADTKHDH